VRTQKKTLSGLTLSLSLSLCSFLSVHHHTTTLFPSSSAPSFYIIIVTYCAAKERGEKIIRRDGWVAMEGRVCIIEINVMKIYLIFSSLHLLRRASLCLSLRA
jgi:hypothetical protein